MALHDHTIDRQLLTPRVQGLIGAALAAAIFGLWLGLHLALVLVLPWGTVPIWAVPLPALLVCWLSVGLFIVAHDAMHGSLLPGAPRANQTVGRLALLVYAGMWFDAVRIDHHAHHRHAGTADDPDFDERSPHGFWRWYASFMGAYLSLTQLAIMAAWVMSYILLLSVDVRCVLAFWLLPLLASTVQLFAFGTWLPHRPLAHDTFADLHRARSSPFSWLVSLLTCFHFGYHHEHHLHPSLPWWRLPAARRHRSVP
jgi:beta-carotene ketolase (CrtW type)